MYARNLDASGEKFSELVGWAAQPGQTDQTIRKAIQALEAIDFNTLHGKDSLKSNNILCRRFLAGDEQLSHLFYNTNMEPYLAARQMLLSRLMPWERAREERQLNLFTGIMLRGLHQAGEAMARGENVSDFADPYRNRPWESPPLNIAWRIQRWGDGVISNAIAFETYRRATLLILAIEAYRLQHGELPAALDDLTGDPGTGDAYFETLPHDPYSGRDFVYFPQGIPQPRTPIETAELEESERSWYRRFSGTIQLGVPCLWSPGMYLLTRQQIPNTPASETEETTTPALIYYSYRHHQNLLQIPDYHAWLRGESFPIPAQLKEKPAE